MAKLSSINKNERRKKLVKKYAGQYAKLKAAANERRAGPWALGLGLPHRVQNPWRGRAVTISQQAKVRAGGRGCT